ncbi:MAG: SAM-dependent methyltransferase [Clostridia bacterium]|nr:SAM-dependent methyltransferase [Clostridia bacterium]
MNKVTEINQDTQIDYFDNQYLSFMNKKTSTNINEDNFMLNTYIVDRLKKYTLKDYNYDIENLGIEKTWSYICQYVLKYGENKDFLNISNFVEMYEIALALVDKQNKKESGQYYTPEDVALVMSKWFDKIEAKNICDVACGTGKLILTYFDYIGKKRTIDILNNRRLYIYDLDSIALKICKTSILLKYGLEYEDKINVIQGDFLNKKITLPEDCKVISNPPYTNINNIPPSWDKTNVLLDTKELYSVFIEKIIKQSSASVIITPYSFIGGSKFYSLRKLMNNYNGFIVSFDNVPGNIFCGRKHGIFNTNTSNSVRAAITVVENKYGINGFKLSPLIRFKNKERDRLLQCEVLENFIYEKYQIVDTMHSMYFKCDKRLGEIFNAWKSCSKKTLNDYVGNQGCYKLSMPNTCRYFTTASNKLLNRTGQIELNFEEESVFNFIYCLINSSFAYWYWRIYDGGITYPKKLLLSMPIFYDKITQEDKAFFNSLASEMIKLSDNFIVHKNNIGIQENIKFPRKYRDLINERLLKILQIDKNVNIFDIIHSNMALEVNL